MKSSQRKEIQKEYAKQSISKYFNLIKNNFYPTYNEKYIKEILKLSQSFNIRLSRNEKLNFCKKCLIKWDVKSREIRLNSKNQCREYICKKCGFIRRFKYKN